MKTTPEQREFALYVVSIFLAVAFSIVLAISAQFAEVLADLEPYTGP